MWHRPIVWITCSSRRFRSTPQVVRQNVGLTEKILQLKLAESRLTRECHLLNERVHFLGKVDL